MSKLPLSPWNHLCWKDEGMSFDISALLKIYDEVFSKYPKYIQAPYYHALTFQGSTDDDHVTALHKGPITNVKINGVNQPIPNSNNENYKFWSDQAEKFSVRHKILCTGEFSKILDYLEDTGWRTFRARVAEVFPEKKELWHFDGYNGSIKYHVPLITNEESYLQWKDGSDEIKTFHLPADGSGYWVNTDVTHNCINKGTTMRAHIIVDVIKK
jgi:hypothetical protein